MEAIELQATPRTVIGKQVNALRREGIIPGVIYGTSIEPVLVQFPLRELERTVRRAGSSTLVNVTVEGATTPYTTIIRDVQYHRIRRTVHHVDLQALNLNETVRVPVPLVLVGESSAVKNLNGILLQLLNEVEIECLPANLVKSIEVDISKIVALGQGVTVGDITAPTGITILTQPIEWVVQVAAPEGAEGETEAVATPGEVEVIRKVRAEEAE